MRQHNATFANFICKFGEEKVLLDYAEEIVIPAFTKDTYVRNFGERTHYHFYEVELNKVADKDGTPVLALAGQFIKDKELTRHQIFDQKQGLIHDEARMRSAPSVFFVLILNNHRLIYFPETPHAPDLGSFKATAQNFLKRRHKEYITERYDAAKQAGQKITKKALFQTHPAPALEVIALTGQDNIETFIRRYNVLKKIDFRLVKPNDDIDAGEILNQVREFSGKLNSDKTNVTTANSEGLDVDAAVDAVSSATESGNQEVKLSGVDQDGNTLDGNNTNFQVNTPIETLPATKSGLISKLYDAFVHLSESGAIRAPGVEGATEKIRRVARLL